MSPQSDDFSLLQLMIYFATIAGFGGVANYLSKIKGKKISIRDLAMEFFISSFVGVVFGLFFIATDMPLIMALAGAGLSGHMGTRSLMLLRDKYNLDNK